MKPEELMEKMDETHEVLILLGKRIDELAKKEVVRPEIRIPDYSRELEELKSLVTRTPRQSGKSALEEMKIYILEVMNKLGSVDFRTKGMTERFEHLDSLIGQLPKTVTQTQHHHHLGNGSKWMLAGLFVLSMVTSIICGFGYSLYRENARLHDNDVKLRMIRQRYPTAVQWADTTFYHDPQNAEKVTQELEAKALAIAEANATARQKQQEAEDAKSAVRKLKQQ
ncbi:MAG: hypothetical protein EOP41_05385 [Sphingobacteriaceae bacterium]|nr:MAG: hypothetical protein EOP41_05385 [Sphingobacteriaceae bacterium]